MNTTNIPSFPGHCDGCDKQCKYGYVRTHDGKILPTINGHEEEYFIRADGIITSAAVSTPAYAQQLAHQIARRCPHHYRMKQK